MIEAKFSTNYGAVKARIRRLPKLVEQSADTFSKKDAVGLIETFRQGISDGSFGLEPLKPATVAQKQREGKRKPGTPLFGEGDSEDNSYINTFAIRRLKKGYRVFPRWAKHHKSGLTLRELFDIHEHGALIRMRDGTIIRIPPRPAFAKAFRRHLNKRKQQENVKSVQDAIDNLIKTGKTTKFNKIIKKTKETDKYDET